MGSHRLRLILIIAFTAVVLGVGTTAVVDVTVTDMGAMMGPGMMGFGGNGPYGPP
jgi:hypothetical protein